MVFSVCPTASPIITNLEHRQYTELLGDRFEGRDPGWAKVVQHQWEEDHQHHSEGSLGPGYCMLAAVGDVLTNVFFKVADCAVGVIAFSWKCI